MKLPAAILPNPGYDPIMFEDYIREEMTFAFCPHVNRRRRKCQRCLTRLFDGAEVMPECKEKAQAAADAAISALRATDAQCASVAQESRIILPTQWPLPPRRF